MKEEPVKCLIPHEESLPERMSNGKEKQLLMGRFGG